MAMNETYQRMPLSGKLYCVLTALQGLTVLGLEIYILWIVLRDVENVFGRWSSDKCVAIYFVLFVLAQIFNMILGVDAVRSQDSVQVLGLTLLNIFVMSLSIFRYFQVRAWLKTTYYENVLERIRPVMLADIGILGGMGVLWMVFTYLLYHNFGWEIYKRVGADMKIRRMYISYRILVLLLKIDFFMFCGFASSFIILVLRSSDPEFAVTIALFPVTLLILFIAFVGIRRESIVIMWTFVFCLCGSVAYFVYKCARMYDNNQKEKYEKQKPMMTYYTIVSLVIVTLTLFQSIVCMANFGYGLKARIEMTRGKRSDMEQIQDYYVNSAGARRMPLEG